MGPKVTARIELEDLTGPQLEKLENTLNLLGKQVAVIGAEAGNSLGDGFRRAAQEGERAGRQIGETMSKSLTRAGQSGQRAGETIAGGMRVADEAVIRASNDLHKLFNLGGNGTTIVAADKISISMRGVQRAANEADTSLTRVLETVNKLGERAGHQISFAGMILGGEALHQIHNVLGAGLSYQQVKAHGIASGLSAEELKGAESFVNEQVTAGGGLIDKTEALRSYIEARSVMSHAHEATEGASIVLQAKAAIKAGGGTEEQVEGMDKLLKAGELLGYTNPENLRKYINDQVRAMQVMGSTISPEDQYEAAKYARNAGANLSEHFLTHTLNSLAQEVGGSTAGVLIRDFYQHAIGGHMTHQGLKNLVAAGIVSMDDVELTKTGEAKGLKPGRHVADYMTAMSDPDKWVLGVNDRLKAKGMSDPDIAAWWSHSFDSGTADFAVKTTKQHETWARHAAMYDSAAGLDAPRIVSEAGNPTPGLQSARGSITNAATDIGKVATDSKAFSESLNLATKAAQGFSSWFSGFSGNHPAAAQGLALGSILGGGALAGMATYGLGVKMPLWLLRAFLGGGSQSAATLGLTTGEAGAAIPGVASASVAPAAALITGGVVTSLIALGLIGRDATAETKKPAYKMDWPTDPDESHRLWNKMFGQTSFEGGWHRVGLGAGPGPSPFDLPNKNSGPAAPQVTVSGQADIHQQTQVTVELGQRTTALIERSVKIGLTTNPAKTGTANPGPVPSGAFGHN